MEYSSDSSDSSLEGIVPLAVQLQIERRKSLVSIMSSHKLTTSSVSVVQGDDEQSLQSTTISMDASRVMDLSTNLEDADDSSEMSSNSEGDIAVAKVKSGKQFY